MEKLLRTTTPPASVQTHRYAYPDKSGFRGPRFQSASPTHVERHQLPIRTFTSQWLCCSQQRILNGSRYTVELYIDPKFLQVPHRPDFSSGACRITTASEALVCCTRHPLSVGPADRSFTDFHYLPGHISISSDEPCPGRPIPAGHRPVGLSRRRKFHPPALNVAWRAQLRAPRFTALSSTGLSMTGGIRLRCLSRGAWPPPDSSSWWVAKSRLAQPDCSYSVLFATKRNLFYCGNFLPSVPFLFGYKHEAVRANDFYSQVAFFAGLC